MMAKVIWNIAKRMAGIARPSSTPSTREAKMLKGTKPRALHQTQSNNPEPPNTTPDAHGDHAHHHGVQHTLTTNQAAVEKGEAWCHQQHQSRRGQNPSRVRCRNCVHEGMMETGPTIFNTPLDSLRQTFTVLDRHTTGCGSKKSLCTDKPSRPLRSFTL